MFGLVRKEPEVGVRPALPSVWDPWGEMTRMRREMDETLARMFGGRVMPKLFEPFEPLVPPIELFELEGEYKLTAQLPGVSPEDINLEVTDHGVHLWGEKREAVRPEQAREHVNTAVCGRFEFRYELSVPIRKEEVKATYREGVLEVVLPKVEITPPDTRKVEITR